MTIVRKAEERGAVHFGWLVSYHTFSFGDYYDAQWMGYRSLRVINTDAVAPGAGFPTHPHREMEIITYMLEGELAHKDSMGNGSVIRPGDVQRMSAGTGITHSEYNASPTEEAKLIQIWIIPNRRGSEPSYEQETFNEPELQNLLRIVASPDGRDGSVSMQADAQMLASKLDAGLSVSYRLDEGRGAWLQLLSGEADVNGARLSEGDGMAVEGEPSVDVHAVQSAHFLLFDLA